MSDKHFRNAQRRWIMNRDRDAWIGLLRQARRMGEPVFTPDFITQALQGELVDFQYTDDGFEAKLKNAAHPAIELEFRISPPGYEPEGEYFPIWDHWSGYIRLGWSDSFAPECPELEIKVADYSAEGGYFHSYIGEYFVYEHDCVTNQEEFLEAVRERVTDWTP